MTGPVREQRRDDLWDLLVAAPLGVTVDDMMAVCGWTHHQSNMAIRDLRRHLGDTDTVNLICEPQGQSERWLYRLVGNLADVRGWVDNRIGDADSRIRTLQAVMTSIVSATSGRTTEGKKARVMEKALRRLVEDLDDIAVDSQP
jgi:hypothetical protein